MDQGLRGELTGVSDLLASKTVAGFVITSSIPAPEYKKRGVKSKLLTAMLAMSVGESLLLPKKTAKDVAGYYKLAEPARFTARTMSNGCRVWRIK